MRTLAIGDIHGSLRALEVLADFAQITEEDTLVTLGDYVDRGPDSRGVLDWLLRWDQEGRLVPLRGNHEVMFVQARNELGVRSSWLSFGGAACLRSYGRGGKPGGFEDVPLEHWRFMMARCARYYETERHIFVHAYVDHSLPMALQDDNALYWMGIHDAGPHVSGKVVVCGHSSQRSGRPLDLGYAVCIDTYAYGGGWLTCLEVQTGRYWQASEAGRTRTGRLEARRA